MNSMKLWFCYNRLLFLLGALIVSSVKACYITLEDSEGELAPPLYPQIDLVNLQCTWVLRAQEGQVVELFFKEIKLDSTLDDHGNCLETGRITVYDGLTTQIIPPFCGDGPSWPRFPIRLMSKTNEMVISFVNTAEGNTGFIAEYKHVSPRQELLAVLNVDNPVISLFDRLSSLKSSEVIHLLGSSSPSALSFDPISKVFFFTDIQKKAIGRASLEDKSVAFILEENIETPLGIAVAYLTGLLYWTDAGRHEISVSRLDGSFRKNIMTSSSECRAPKGIVLSRDNQYIFWTCEGRIEKAKADGSERNPTFVIDNVEEPSALAIDTDGTYIYWVDVGTGHMSRIRVDGVDRTTILQSMNTFLTHLHSLVMDEFAFFFTHSRDQNVYMIERNVEEIELRFIQLNPPETFGGLYYYNSDMVILAQHACTVNNGGCERLCFPDGSNVNCEDTTTTSSTSTTNAATSESSSGLNSSTTDTNQCSNFSIDALFSECLAYTIVGLVISVIVVLAVVFVSWLCCCGCRKYKPRRGNERTPSTKSHVFTIPETKKVVQDYYVTEGNYATVI